MDMTGITIEELERELQRRRTAVVAELRARMRIHLKAIDELEAEISAIRQRTPGMSSAQEAPRSTKRGEENARKIMEVVIEAGCIAPSILAEKTGLTGAPYRSAIATLLAAGRLVRHGHAKGITYQAGSLAA